MSDDARVEARAALIWSCMTFGAGTPDDFATQDVELKDHYRHVARVLTDADRFSPSDGGPALEAAAKAIYVLDPFYEGGEYVDGFQVSPGGALTWEQACARDAEFSGDPVMLPITKFAKDAALAALAAADRLAPDTAAAELNEPDSPNPGGVMTLESVRAYENERAAVAAERERCAKIAEGMAAPYPHLRTHDHVAREIAAAIRQGEPACGLASEGAATAKSQWEMNMPILEWAEEHFCSCGCGHGSGEAHTEGCEWLKLEPVYKALLDANEMMRSMSSIVRRKGVQTNWEDFEKQLDKSLRAQHAIMFPEEIAVAIRKGSA